MALYNTEAITIKNYDLDEADKILVLFTAKYGKIRVVAKGARKVKSTFAAAIEPFTYTDIVFYRGKSDLGQLNQCDINESFAKIKQDITKMSYAFYITELIDVLTTDDSVEQAAFELFILTLRLLDRMSANKLITRAFELKLLRLLGYKPNLSSCIKCEKEGGAYFDFEAGGVLCGECRGRFSRQVSAGSLKYMNKLLNMEYRNMNRLVLPDYVNQEIMDLLSKYIEYLTGKKLKSSAFIDAFEI